MLDEELHMSPRVGGQRPAIDLLRDRPEGQCTLRAGLRPAAEPQVVPCCACRRQRAPRGYQPAPATRYPPARPPPARTSARVRSAPRPSSTSMLAIARSPSSSTTRRPNPASVSARFTATTLLPTPPLPLITAMSYTGYMLVMSLIACPACSPALTPHPRGSSIAISQQAYASLAIQPISKARTALFCNTTRRYS